MEQLIAAQRDLHGRIARSYDNLRKAGAARMSVALIQSTLSLLEKKWMKFEAQHDRLQSEYWDKLVLHEYHTSDVISAVEDTYALQRAAMLELEMSLGEQSASPEVRPARSEMGPQRSALPRIQLPQFSGKFEDWPAFRDLFKSIVASEPSLSKVEKIHYLKTSVKGDAEQLIKNLPSTEDNFDRAWSTLTDHFENKRLLVRAYLTAFTSLPKMKPDSVSDLRRIFHGVVTTVGALEGIGRPVSNCTDLFVHLAVELLDARTRREWENAWGRSTVPPSYDELREFLQEQLLTQEILRPADEPPGAAGSSSRAARSTRTHHAKKKGVSFNRSCPICKEDHFIMVCDKYKAQTAQGRLGLVDTYRLCRNCLGRHQVADCPSAKTCNKCAARHHTSLHDASANTTMALTGPTSAAAVMVSEAPPAACPAVLLATARVLVTDRFGKRHPVRALVDSGSETCLITESLAQRLRLPRTPTSVAIFGVGGQQSGVARGRVNVTLAPRTLQSTLRVSALVLPQLTTYAGSARPAANPWAYLRGLELADPEFQDHDPVELLLGADAYARIALPGLRRGSPSEPIAQQTELGWILLGTVGDGHSVSVTSLQCSPADELTGLVRRFWEQEEPPRAPLPPTPDEQECEEHFLLTHSRTPEGRYQVRLPFRGELPALSATRQAAARMWGVMERRFTRETLFRDQYRAFMAEYAALGHMSIADAATDARRTCYLPHHGVVKGTGDCSKIRVVFNGSTQLGDGTSLNGSLHSGPNLLPALVDVITRWRRHRYAISADIEKMYRQILVHPDDRDWQRILWTEGGNIIDYRLNTVTYGLACAPYSAIRVLRQLAADEEHVYPRGATALREDTYVDDIVSAAATLAGARALRDELTRLCEAGGFPLRKWSANDVDLLAAIPPEHRTGAAAGPLLPADEQAVLGLRWDSEGDFISLVVRQPRSVQPTKRSLLSGAAQLFDPLGWCAPVIVRAKLLIQTTWLQQLDWDAPLAETEARAWTRLQDELPLLKGIRVSRWLHGDQPGSRVEIHGFSDASERAYAAAIYLRVQEGSEVSVTLVLARTKVAPLKQVSIPRLELCAATLLARMAAHVRDILALPEAPIRLWTDSTVTLGWIRGHPARWTTFVANRVAEIQRTIPDGQWYHIPGRDNPADCASRGMTPGELLAHRLWWQGPAFLEQEPSRWPPTLPLAHVLDDLPEQRPERCLAAGKRQEPEELTRFSSLRRLLRVSTWMLRWRTRPRMAATKELSPDEMERVLGRWLGVVQAVAFQPELREIAGGRSVPGRSPLCRLTPTIDDLGILRVGGRIKNAPLPADLRHPVILPPESHLTHLIIDDGHRRTLHGGVQATLATIRQRYWIPRGRQLVRRHILRCPSCVRWRAASPQPLMGSLPGARVSPSRPFLHTGVDFAGPILLRTTRGRGHKAYKAFLAVFVCFSSRAVHLEVVSDYSADAFLAALRRFMSRRGLCHTIYSDRGTNFVGADSHLRALLDPAGQEIHRVVGRLATDGIRWRFNPPAAPHFGGLWEAAVKAVKHHLRRVIGETRLTFEEMSTFLAEVEVCLNSRPLQALSDDPEDIEALTPGHFLIGAPLNAVPEPSLLEASPARLSRWRLLQNMRDHWWHRWAQEYVQRLLPRPKWWSGSTHLREGQLCLLRNELTPPSRWPLARIIRLHRGDDDQVRVVDVRTRGGTLTRPVVKIVPLPAADVDETLGDATGTSGSQTPRETLALTSIDCQNCINPC